MFYRKDYAEHLPDNSDKPTLTNFDQKRRTRSYVHYKSTVRNTLSVYTYGALLYEPAGRTIGWG